MLNNKSDIAFTYDIVKELSQELSIPEKELEEIIKYNIEFIKEDLGRDPEVTVIKLGKGLGKLIANSYFIRKEIEKNKNSPIDRYKSFVEKVLKPRLKKMDVFIDNTPYRKTKYNKIPFLYRLKHILNRKADKKIRGVYEKPHRVWDKVSQIQNKENL